MMKLARLALALVLLSAPLAAQTVDSWTLRVYHVGALAPLSTTVLPFAQVVCNQAPPAATASSVNPQRVIWTDESLPTRVCIWVDPGTGPLLSVPFGAIVYEGTLTATNAVLTTVESPRASFTRPGLAPGVPTGLRFAR